MKTNFACFVLLGMIMLTACSEQNYYDPNSQEVPKELSDLSVPSGFDWTTSSQIALNLDVNDQYNGAYYYKVQVFDNNPIITPEASLLAEGLAKKNEPFKAKVTYAKSDSILYVQETDPTGKKTVKAIYASGSSSTVKAASGTKSANLTYTQPTRTYTTPSNAIVVSGNSPLYANPQNGVSSFVIPAGQTFEGQIINTAFSDVFVYVEGTWKNTASLTSLNNIKLIIQNGGKYIPTLGASSIIANGTSKIVVAATGQFNPEDRKVDIEMNNERAQIINNSSVFNVNNILNIKDLFNYGTMFASGTLSTNTSGVQLINEGSLTTWNLVVNGANIINTCKIEVSNIATIQNATINIASETLFISKLLNLLANTTIALDSRAILEVSNVLQFDNTEVYIKGPDSGDKALLRIEHFTINPWTRPSFLGNLQVESSKYPKNKNSMQYYVSPNVEFVEEGESTLNIPSTDCNAGGNIVEPNVPTPITYPLDVTLGDTYSYAFEDNYPSIGDYDMNDFVLDVKLEYTLSAANKVSKLDIKTKVKAIGASKRLAAAIQLDGVLKGNVKSVIASGTLFKGDVFSVANGLENNQTYAVLPITDDAHALFGVETNQVVNTRADKSYLPAKDVVFSVTFNNPVDLSAVSLIDMLNVFIINGGYSSSDRKEIHLRGYKPTEKSTDLSSGRNYSSSDFVYAIRTPKSVNYPLEWTKISDAYSLFKIWVSSNGQTNPDWYNAYQTDKVYLLE